MATVSFDHVWKRYGEVTAVNDLTLDIQDEEFLVLVGPSGCGKTTALRMIAGLEEISEGTLKIGDRVVNELAPKDRDVAMVFQSYALYPHMSVFDNLAFGLKLRKVPKDQIKKRVEDAAATIELTNLLDRKPKQLSGGQRQRVALGRAIVREPAVFLMDEPLSNLDAKLRVQTRTQIASLQRRLGVTTVYVTHDQTEALTMGDRIAVLKDGVLQQIGTPHDMYDSPANIFVGGFIGSPAMNIGTFRVENGAAVLGATSLPLSRETLGAITDADKRHVSVGFRPESLDITSSESEGAFPVVVSIVEELGSDAFVYGELKDAHDEAQNMHSGAGDAHVIVRVDPRSVPKMGDQIWVTIRPDTQHYFAAATGERIA